MKNPTPASITDLFEKHFNSKPTVCARAPGRVNLIGEHTDYNGGHVLPMAIAYAVEIAASPRSDGQFRLHSQQIGDAYEGELPPDRLSRWTDYVFGVVHEFGKLGRRIEGMDAVVNGTIPRASGLSSSAALEVATAWVVQHIVGSDLSPLNVALLSRRAENLFVGVSCGIMDQAISALGTRGHALFLDCESLRSQAIPLAFDEHAAVLVAHSGVRRGLSQSAYNQRLEECNTALGIIRDRTGNEIPCLCAATLENLKAASGAMDSTLRKRARHAITEESRTLEATEAMTAGNLSRMGELLNASHESLREDYEVSCPELDELTSLIRSQPGVYGSRLTGAGFGGCTVSLVDKKASREVIERLKVDYYATNRLKPIVFLTAAEEGVRQIEQ